MRHRQSVILLAAILFVASAAGAAEPVVSNVYENLDADKALTNVPVTFSRVAADGHFTKGVMPVIDGLPLPAQVDVLRRGPDKSIRHALVSFVLPKLPAGGKVKIDWLDAKPPVSEPFKWALDKESFAAKLVLTEADGGVLTSDVGRIISGAWKASERVKVLYDGPVMKEFEIHDAPVNAEGAKDARMDVYWRLRVFTGQKSVRISAVVERCKMRKRGRKEPRQMKLSEVKLFAGDKELYREGPIDHLDQTRYRILVWSAGKLEDIHRRPNYDYWQKHGFVCKYKWVKGRERTGKQVDTYYLAKRGHQQKKPVHKQGILENGIITNHMPNTGGRWDLAPYPSWVAAYLLGEAGEETYRTILHADGNGGGAFPMHVRQDAGNPGYNIFAVKDKPQDRPFWVNIYRLPDGTKPPTQPDHSHAPSMGYISYMITGDKYYAEEASFWAAYQAGGWPWQGLKWGQMSRGFAWGFRHVTDAAFILPDGHPLVEYYTKIINKCLDEMTAKLVKSDRKVHSPIGGVFDCSGRAYWVNALRCSTWQYAWVVWGMGNAANKGFPKAAAVRDWTAEYIVGLYTSEDEWTGPDGKIYKYDPRDALSYSTAIAAIETKIVIGKNGGRKAIRVKGGKRRQLDNYGEIWYYTKLNVDNSHGPGGLTRSPDADGNWLLRPPGEGFGGGFMYWASGRRKRARHFNYHEEAMEALTVAIEGNVPKAREAWKKMLEYGGKRGKYGILTIPRVKGFD